MKVLRFILFGFLLASGLAGGGIAASRLNTFNEEFEQIKTADEIVIKKLKKLRIAQKRFFEVHNHYAPTWDSLFQFVKNGKIPIIQVSETVFSVNGKDSVIFTTDTLEIAPAFEALKDDLKCSKENVSALANLSLPGGKFELYTNTRQGERFIQVTDPFPLNPKRQKGGKLKPLRFGSKAAATLKGNWE